MSDETMPTDTPYEHRVCSLTLICALVFLGASAYYFVFSPPKDDIAIKMVMVTGGIFALSLANFFIAAFKGKICGQKDK